MASIIVTRILGKEGFGELGIIQSTVGMFGVFAGFGLGMTATKYVAEFRTKDPGRAGHVIALSNIVSIISGGVMSLILVFVASWLANHTLAAPHLTSLLQIAAGLLFLSALNGAQTGALAGFEAFKTIARVNFWAGIANFPLMVIGVYLAGITGAVWGLIAGVLVNLILNYVAINAETKRMGIPVRYNECLQEWGILWKFSLPAALAGAMVGPINWASNAMLVNQPKGYAEMGIFNAANQWFTALLFLPWVVGQTVLPMLSERLGEEDKESSGTVLGLSIKLNCLIVLPLVIGGCLASPFIMHLYGDGFKEKWLTLVVVLVTAGLLAVETPVGHIIAASGRMWVAFIMNMAWGLAFLTITSTIIDQGALGLAVARLGAYVLHATWTFGFAYWVFKDSRSSTIYV